jgi:6-phosphofructokinase 1
VSRRKEVLALVVGGGPAPGINGVISAATIEALNRGLVVLGISGGFKSLFEGRQKAARRLTLEAVSRIHSTGGSILGTSREFPRDFQRQFALLLQTLKGLKVRYLITIGGEGTLHMARLIQEASQCAVVHVPKTIDNDLPLPAGLPTFGYETARHWGVEIVKNLMEDARATERWYFVKTMGRFTGHLALGIGKAAGATITLIPEEFPRGCSIHQVADTLEGAIIKRLSMGRHYGVAVLAEGISGRLESRQLQEIGPVATDEAGRVSLTKIKLEEALMHLVSQSMAKRGLRGPAILALDIGYELRAAPPIPFDAEYTRNLGYGAVKELLEGGRAAVVVFYEGRLKALPFKDMLGPDGAVRLRYIDTSSEGYTVARKYMLRLEPEDLKGARLRRLAQAARMSPAELKARFSYLFRGP